MGSKLIWSEGKLVLWGKKTLCHQQPDLIWGKISLVRKKNLMSSTAIWYLPREITNFHQKPLIGQFISYFCHENDHSFPIFMGHMQNNIFIRNSCDNIIFPIAKMFVILYISVLWLWFTLQNQIEGPTNRHFFLI